MDRGNSIDTVASRARGIAQSGVRVANERAVLTLIAQHPGSSNADLARLSGLGPQTTSRIVADLETRDLVTRGDVLRGRRGQPATPLFLNPDGAYAMGVEIGWRHFEVLLFAMSGKTLASVRRYYAWPDARSIVSDVAAEIATVRSGMTPVQASRLVAIGLSTPSHMDHNLIELGAPEDQVALWSDIDLVARLKALAGLPVAWINDGSAGCWSEHIARHPQRSRGIAYLQVGTQIAAGIVAAGELWEGPTGDAANLGGVIVPDAQGKLTSLHRVASLLALEERLARDGRALPPGSPNKWDWSSLEPVAGDWIESAARALATAIVSTRAVIELDRAVVDGVMPRPVVERLVARVGHHLAQLPVSSLDRPQVEIGTHGASAAATGAAQLMLFRRFFSRDWTIFAT